jgi:hypothetical protein
MDVVINKLTIFRADHSPIDKFFNEQIHDNKISFNNLLPVPNDIKLDHNYDVEFIYSNTYDNAIYFARNDNNFSYKIVQANIYNFFDKSEYTNWAIENWSASEDIDSQELIINELEFFYEIYFYTRYDAPALWFSELTKKYSDIEFVLESISYDYKFNRYWRQGEDLMQHREPYPNYQDFDGFKMNLDDNLDIKDSIYYDKAK